MPYYMTQAAYTGDAVKSMMASPQDRAAVLGKIIEAAGGKMVQFFFTFGEYDVVIISEAPDNTAYAWVALAAAAGGGVARLRTTVLMTPEEGAEAFQRAGSVAYAPPGS